MALLFEQHPNAFTELDFRTPFELLAATIMSAQSTDKRVNEVTPALFKKFPDARAMAQAPQADLERDIKTTGFFRQKAKALIGMAQALVDQHGGEVPADMDALTALPGVGRKTANVVLGHALGVPGLPVDRHVLRVANRIGIAQAQTPEEVETQLTASMPREQVDAHLRHADPPRPPHLPSAPALRTVPRRRTLRIRPRLAQDRRLTDDRGQEPRLRAKAHRKGRVEDTEASAAKRSDAKPRSEAALSRRRSEAGASSAGRAGDETAGTRR